MIVIKQKQYGVPGEMAKLGLRAMGRGAAVAGLGTAGTAAGAGTLASAGLLKLGTLAAAHPILTGAAVLGGIGYGIHKLLKRRRERRAAERGYSVIEKMYSDPEAQERYFAKVPWLTRKLKRFYKIEQPTQEVVERAKRIAQIKKGGMVPAMKLCSVLGDDIYMPVPKAPREEVPKKIVKKAKKSGVVQKDSDGNWRIINMNGPDGKAIYWKPKYSSKEKAENALKSYHSGGWNKK